MIEVLRLCVVDLSVWFYCVKKIRVFDCRYSFLCRNLIKEINNIFCIWSVLMGGIVVWYCFNCFKIISIDICWMVVFFIVGGMLMIILCDD